MKKKYFVLLRWVVVAILLALLPQRVRACSCAVPGPPADALAKSTAVFAGRVIDVKFPSFTGSSADPVYVTFNVSRVWKGPAFRSLQVETALSGSSCGYGFITGEEYLVYSYGEETDLQVSLCGRTELLENAEEDLAIFGAGTVPTSNRTVYLPTLLRHEPHTNKAYDTVILPPPD